MFCNWFIIFCSTKATRIHEVSGSGAAAPDRVGGAESIARDKFLHELLLREGGPGGSCLVGGGGREEGRPKLMKPWPD